MSPSSIRSCNGRARAELPRHRVKNNLPGTPEFCPLVFRTDTLAASSALDLGGAGQGDRRRGAARYPRADGSLPAAKGFTLQLCDRGRAPAAGPHPALGPRHRRSRPAAADPEELLRLQRIVLGDARFVRLGFRQEGGFVGEHDRETRMPLPDHISARPGGPAFADRRHGRLRPRRRQTLDAVIAAAILAFGFVYIHPFEDGNGRIHRYLIHHVLAERGFNPPGVVFPVSAAILERIDHYRRVLEDYSQRLLPLIEWRPSRSSMSRF